MSNQILRIMLSIMTMDMKEHDNTTKSTPPLRARVHSIIMTMEHMMHRTLQRIRPPSVRVTCTVVSVGEKQIILGVRHAQSHCIPGREGA